MPIIASFQIAVLFGFANAYSQLKNCHNITPKTCDNTANLSSICENFTICDEASCPTE